MALGFGSGLCPRLELRGERHVVEETPGIVKLGIPSPL